ncbi:ABC transporter permease subunit [Anaerocolumna sedimenticola]|uniref:ABC transporter permease subunit n=2 Tax=Anaerocolumna sedimenticola TaxID=2696063 RepID=A0A6P1TUJ2_9FIRM|nr:ABC transporter permease subunit [Anaerocolumna sedimenticola]QHQ63651.1 ABC transporter permease subunit [Anaerocolumna sedimenticola]
MKQVKSAVYNNKYRILAVVFWITVWQSASMLISKEMLLASPFAVIKALGFLTGKGVFWLSIFNSFLKILMGFLLAIILGILLAVLSYKMLILKEIISPLMKIIQATPVASFIILALLWVESKNLSILCSFLMVIPVIYVNVLQGIVGTDPKLKEMAYVFQITSFKKVRYIYLPAVMPYFVSASTVGLGLCWKAGIAAEVIGLPKFSIGEQLYEAKIYLMTDELFAWTIVIILISVISERLIIRLIHRVQIMLT